MSLQVRDMLASEKAMVLSDWKKDLAARPWERPWGKCLTSEEFWAVLDHVIERITLPSCRVMVCVHDSEPLVPLAWIALRQSFVLHQYASRSLRDQPELAAAVQRELWSRIDHAVALPTFNPILELRR